MDTLNYIVEKYGLDFNGKMPVEINNFGRNDLARLFNELGFRTGAEIGVERGLFTEVLCRENPQAKIFAVDAWKAYRGYRDHVSQAKLDGFYHETETRISGYNCVLVRQFSMEAVRKFADGELDFVYIDANHELPFVIGDIIEWSKKVRTGGIISGHDYRQSKRFDSRNHVVNAVHAYTGAYRIRPWFVLGSKAKVSGEVRDEARSWMWVK